MNAFKYAQSTNYKTKGRITETEINENADMNKSSAGLPKGHAHYIGRIKLNYTHGNVTVQSHVCS